MSKHTILFLAANPRGTGENQPNIQARRIALDQEANAIRRELSLSGYRHRFELVTRWAAEPHDLLRELRTLKPTVVHFSGHGRHDGLFFQAPTGEARVVSPAAIAETFEAAGGSVRVVVLSACYSEAPAEALLAHVECVVGMTGALHDGMAKAFAIGFYGALCEQESVAAAYRHGNAAIGLEGLADLDRPRLKVRMGSDASGMVLAADEPDTEELPCPYPGMRPYAADDSIHFHGRGTELDELLGRLRAGERELYLIGPSGSGKSSLVAAGLLPRLARGLAGLGPFVVRSMRPGEHPATRLGELLEAPDRELTALAEVIATLLAGRAASSSVLIVIDQLEELFTLAGAHEREQFERAFRSLREVPRCVVVSTLRADFFGAFMESLLWTGRRGRPSRIEVDPMRGEALLPAIVRPASDLGVHVEPELIGRLLDDAGAEPGVLPLLQETLVQLWDRKQGQTLRLADYHALGDGGRNGIAVALSRRADALLRDLTAEQEAIARRILLRLVSFGEGRSDTRRQQPRSRLQAVDDDAAEFDFVIRRLIAARLLVAGEDERGGEARIDLAHEIMIEAWPTLASWIQIHRAEERHRCQLEAAAVRWVERGRSARDLLDPGELADAETWQGTKSAWELGQNVDVAALIAASEIAQDKQRRRRRRALAALAVFAAVVAVFAFFAHQQADSAENSHRQAEASRVQAEANRRQAEESRKQAEESNRKNQRLLAQTYQEAGRQQLLDGHPQEALPYLMAARKRGEEGESLRMLIWMAAPLPLITLWHRSHVESAAFSPDGTRVVTISYPAVFVWDAATGKLLTTVLSRERAPLSVAFSPDGTRIVIANNDNTVQVWDAAAGKPLAPPLVHQGSVRNASFSRDGKLVVTVSDDYTAQIWDAATGKPLAPAFKPQANVWSVVFSPDGTRVVTASHDRTARVWDAATGKPLAPPLPHQGRVFGAAFSPDGTRVVTASDDHTARVWDAATGKLLAPALAHHTEVRHAAFSPGGTRVVTMSSDHVARVWDAATGNPLAFTQGSVTSAVLSPDSTRVLIVRGNTARVWDVTTGKPLTPELLQQGSLVSAGFSPDGARVVTAGFDQAARVWDIATDKPLAHQAPVQSAVFSPDSTRVVTVSNDHAAVRDAATGKPLTPTLVHPVKVRSAAFSPDGTRLVTVSSDHAARVWDATTGQPVTPALAHKGVVNSVAFSPDNTRVVTASDDKTAQVWDATTGKPLAPALTHRAPVVSSAFSADGTRVITVSYGTNTRVWDAATGKPLATTLVFQDLLVSAAFSPDATRVVTASPYGTARVWDAAGKPLTDELKHQSNVVSVAFSRDGTRVVTVSGDHAARVWDVATGKPLSPALAHQGVVNSATFSPDGTRVVTASDDKTARVWDAVTGKLLMSELAHRAEVRSAAFSPDGTHVVTASDDSTARVWATRLDETPPTGWAELAARSPFVLSNGVHVLRSSHGALQDPSD